VLPRCAWTSAASSGRPLAPAYCHVTELRAWPIRRPVVQDDSRHWRRYSRQTCGPLLLQSGPQACTAFFDDVCKISISAKCRMTVLGGSHAGEGVDGKQCGRPAATKVHAAILLNLQEAAVQRRHVCVRDTMQARGLLDRRHEPSQKVELPADLVRSHIATCIASWRRRRSSGHDNNVNATSIPMGELIRWNLTALQPRNASMELHHS
jgi:hypothetical protein